MQNQASQGFITGDNWIRLFHFLTPFPFSDWQKHCPGWNLLLIHDNSSTMIDVWYIFYSLIKLRISFLDPQSMQSHRSCCLLMTKPKKHSWEEVVVPYRKYPTSEIQLWLSQYSTQRKENVWYTIIPCLLINVIKWDRKMDDLFSIEMVECRDFSRLRISEFFRFI